MGATDIAQANRLLGAYDLGGPVPGGVTRAANSGTPALAINGREFAVTARGAGAVGKTDSVTKEDSPVLKKNENFVVVHTVGFSVGDATTAPAIEHHTLFGAKGDMEARGDVPVHIDARHAVYAVELFENRGSTDFQYGVTNFAATSDTGVKHEFYDTVTLPNAHIWKNF